MKKLMIIAAFTMLLTGCGVGSYSVQSGVEDAAFISFTDDAKQDITVTVDDQTYALKTVKQKAYLLQVVQADFVQTVNSVL